VLIFFLNHPANCGDREVAGRVTRLKAAKVSSQSLCPTPF
jgi:hypothetical protein